MTASKIRESFGERETPSELHALGVSQLLAGRYDDAAQALLAASREQPANANYLNDVATVQLERARLGLRPDDLPRALASADRARRLDPSLKEAWFNRALALNALSLHEQSRNAWTEYLRRDSVSPWAGEARARLQELTKPTTAQAWTSFEGRLTGTLDTATSEAAVRAHVTEARKYIETRLLPAWAAAVAAGGDGEVELNNVRSLADAMMRIAGDALYADAVVAIDRAAREGRLAAIAIAHQQYAVAAATFADDQFAKAVPLLRDAQAALAGVNSPYAIRPAIDLASLTYAGGGYAAAEKLLADALTTARSHQYAYAEGRATWIQGMAAFMQGRLGDAQAKYEDTLAAFTRIGDQEQIAAAHNLLGALFYYIGDQQQALAQFVPALKGLEITRSFKLRHALLIAATTSLRESNPEAALAVQDETVRNAEQWGFQYAISEAYALRASILSSLGRTTDAEIDLDEAKVQMASADASLKPRLETTVLLTESQVLRKKNPAAAADAATRAIAMVEARGDRYRLPQLQLELANANIVWGRTAAAEIALERGIRAFDQERSSLVNEGRVGDEEWGLFETAVHLAIKKNDLPRAFGLAERARVRSLAEARHVPVTRTLADVQSSLRDREAIIALNQFEDELAVWIIKRSGTEVVTRQLARHDAERLIARQQDDIRQQAQFTEAGRALFNEILRPLSRQLAQVDHLVVVPDMTYESVAFAALWDASTKRFLAETTSLNLAPSANAFVAARENTRQAADARPLVFGGVSAAAVTDAQAIASAYTSASVVAGQAATRSSFFASLSAARRTIHLAVPVAVSTSNPLLSRAIVGDDPGAPHSGAIFGRDIANSKLAYTDLVVIDEVASDRTIRGEGTLSMARAFLTAGVPAVVGTLPGADETATRDLMIAFHREMSKGVSAEQALQTVQRNAIQQNGRRLGAWSALVLYGSDR